MTISLGIDHSISHWRVCLMEDGRVLECVSFEDDSSILGYVEQTCALYPEPIITLSADLHVPLSPLNMLVEDMLQSNDRKNAYGANFTALLLELNMLNFRNYVLPDIKYLESIPAHRKLYRGALGDPARLCRIATLLYRLRLQDTVWTNMCFLYLEVGCYSSSLTVVKDGSIIDAVGTKALQVADGVSASDETRPGIVSAFLEMLAQDLAGLLALHHYEDVVLAFDDVVSSCESLKNALIKRFGDLFQLYLYPAGESAPVLFDAAIGAAILAEGLSRPGLAAEVVEKLL